jgi:hypothetical protein
MPAGGAVGRYRRSVSDACCSGRSRQTTLLRAAVALMLLSCMAAAAPAPKTEAKAKKESPAEILPAIDQIVEAQRALAAGLSQLRDQLNETQRAVSELRDATRDQHDATQPVVEQIRDQVEGMRKEVWGLYVESSGLKSDIAQTDKQVDGLDQSLGSFRLSAGIVVAVVIVLQFVLVGLAFRGRG